MTIVLDCGTTNTKLYLVQGKSCIRETVLPVGIRNIAGGMTKTQLKNRIRDGRAGGKARRLRHDYLGDGLL